MHVQIAQHLSPMVDFFHWADHHQQEHHQPIYYMADPDSIVYDAWSHAITSHSKKWDPDDAQAFYAAQVEGKSQHRGEMGNKVGTVREIPAYSFSLHIP